MTDADDIEAVRAFNRFYTRQIGLLRRRLLDSPFPLAESRILYEIAHRGPATAVELAESLGLDQGYLSRILKGFEAKALIARAPSPSDGRQSLIELTDAGRAAFADLDARSRQEVGAMLSGLTPEGRARLTRSMATIESILAPSPAVPYILRPHQPGDMGWIVARHGALYAEEYGWDQTFEALVADIVSAFLRNVDPGRERCWIAERNGEPVGSVFLVRDTDEAAKLRLLLVEPSARGLGIGHRLVDECIRFARLAGYRRITLWTNDVLHAARRIYQQAGFTLAREEPHRSFGKDLVGQYWERTL